MLTANSPKLYYLPNASGTLALTSNLDSYVPYTGATTNVNLGTNTLTAGLLKSTGNIQIAKNAIYDKFGLTGLYSSGTMVTYAPTGTNSSFGFLDGDSGFKSVFNFDNTGDKTYTFPAASGTLALTSNLSSYVPTSRTLTINGTTYDLSANRTWTITAGVSSVTASSPLFSTGGATPNITIQQSNSTQDGYLSSTDWTTFNSKQASGNYITSLTGEATATGPGAAAITLNNASVTAKILTGVNITGGTIQATDTMLTAFGKLQNQINGLVGGSIYQGTWNASTNTPALASGVGTKGYYYIVSVAGTTNLDGITDWNIGDWAIFDGTAWQQVDNTDSVTSVNGFTGAVSLTTDNIPEGVTNLYFTPTRAQNAITLTTTGTSGPATYSGGTLNIPNYTTDLSGYVPTSRTLTINGVTYDLTANRSWTVEGGSTASTRVIQKFTSTAGQTTFTITGGYTVGMVDVFVNGVKLDNATDFTATNGTTVVLTTGLTVGQTVEVYKYGSQFIVNNALRQSTTFTATAGQTTFVVNYAVGLLDVFYNGSKLDSSQYTATNGTSIVLGTACNVNDIVEVIAYNYTVGAFAGVSGTGTTNYLAKWTAAGAIGNSIIQDNGTSVSVGGQLNGTSGVFSSRIYGTTTGLNSDFNSGGLISYGAGNTLKYTQIGYDSTGNYGWIQALEQGTAYRNLILNAAGGNVGIARITPEFTLDVNGDIAFNRTNKLQFAGPVAGDRARSYLTGDGNNNIFVYGPSNNLIATFAYTGYTGLNGVLDFAGTNAITNVSDKFTMGVNTTYAWMQSWGGRSLVINNSGNNVLIGTTTDNGRKLNVNGSGLFAGILSTRKVEMMEVATVPISTNATFTLLSSDKINIRTNILVSVSIYWDNNYNAQRQYLLFLGATDTAWGTPSSAISVIASNDWSSGYVGAATFSMGGSGNSRTLNISVSNAATYNVTAFARVLEM